MPATCPTRPAASGECYKDFVLSTKSSVFEEIRHSGALGPVPPGALGLRRLWLVARAGGARVDLALAERLELTEQHRLVLHARIARQVHRHAHDVDERARRGGEAVPAH